MSGADTGPRTSEAGPEARLARHAQAGREAWSYQVPPALQPPSPAVVQVRV